MVIGEEYMESTVFMNKLDGFGYLEMAYVIYMYMYIYIDISFPSLFLLSYSMKLYLVFHFDLKAILQ